jgi:hypothetical protein
MCQPAVRVGLDRKVRESDKGESATTTSPIRHDTQTINTIPPHKSFKALLLPHSQQTPPNTFILRIRSSWLNLSVKIKDKKTFRLIQETPSMKMVVSDCMIFNLSRGLTTVREAAPAHPPAIHSPPQVKSASK